MPLEQNDQNKIKNEVNYEREYISQQECATNDQLSVKRLGKLAYTHIIKAICLICISAIINISRLNRYYVRYIQ